MILIDHKTTQTKNNMCAFGLEGLQFNKRTFCANVYNCIFLEQSDHNFEQASKAKQNGRMCS